MPLYSYITDDLYEKAVSQFKEYDYTAKYINKLIGEKDKKVKEGDKLFIHEIGCGTGKFTMAAIQNLNNSRIHLIEPDYQFYRSALNKIKILNDNKIKLYNCDFQNNNLKFKYDFVFSSLVWHHIPDEEKLIFLEYNLSLIKDGGKILIFDSFLSSSGRNYENKKLYMKNGITLLHDIYIEMLTEFHQNRMNKMKDGELLLVEQSSFYEGKERINEYKISISQAEMYLSIACNQSFSFERNNVSEMINKSKKQEEDTIPDLGYYLIIIDKIKSSA